MKRKRLLTAVAGGCLVLTQAACGGNAGGPVAATPNEPALSFGPTDPALVGSWFGPMQGGVGPADLTLVLNADGVAKYSGSLRRYCLVPAARWGVSGTEFIASGSDCTGTVVTLRAPASRTSLTGTWSASSGLDGTFSLTKQ